MRIAFLADPLDLQYGGIHYYTKELLTALSKIDTKNEYLIVRANEAQEFKGNHFEEIVVPYRSYPGYRIQRIFLELPKLMVKKGVDMVVEPAHFGPFNLPPNIKRITVIHDMTMFLFPEFHTFFSQFLQQKFLPHILKNTHHIITNSAHTAKDVTNFFPTAKDKITPISLGKDAIFEPQKNIQALQKYNIQAPYFLFVGTLEPRKNIPTLIQAFNDFKTQTHLPHQLVLVGKKGWKSTAIFEAMNDSPFKKDILQLGYVERKDLPAIYTQAEIFVYPSIYEGFGLPIIEAMACGTPVITTNVSSLPEVGGESAHYFSPDSPHQLTQTMMHLCSNPSLCQKSVQLGFQQAAKFSWEQTALQTLQVFEQCQN